MWVLLGQVASASASLVGVRLLTEFTRPEVFGEVNLWLGLALLGRDLFCMPLVQATLRFYAEVAGIGEVARLRQLVSRVLIWTTGLLVLVCLGGGAIYSFWNHGSYLVFAALAGLIIVDVVKNLEVSFLQAARRQRALAIVLGVEAWARPLLAIALISLAGLSSGVILLGYFVGSGGVLLALLAVLPREGCGTVVQPSPELDRRLGKEIWVYSWPLTFQAVIGWFNTLSDRYIVRGILGPQQVGYYIAALSPVSAPFLMVQGIIGTTLRPVYFAAASSGDTRLERKIFRHWVAATSGICALGVVFVILGRDWIAWLLLAEAYRGYARLMPLIAGGYAFYAVAQVCGERLFAHKRTDLIVLSYALGAVACVAITSVLVSLFGIWGAAVSCTLTFLMLLVIILLLSRRVTALR